MEEDEIAKDEVSNGNVEPTHIDKEGGRDIHTHTHTHTHIHKDSYREVRSCEVLPSACSCWDSFVFSRFCESGSKAEITR